jgi:hypothetical protein
VAFEGAADIDFDVSGSVSFAFPVASLRRLLSCCLSAQLSADRIDFAGELVRPWQAPLSNYTVVVSAASLKFTVFRVTPGIVVDFRGSAVLGDACVSLNTTLSSFTTSQCSTVRRPPAVLAPLT